jgi:hypothetical protein
MYVGLAGTASFFQLKYEFRILPKTLSLARDERMSSGNYPEIFPFTLSLVEAFIGFSADSVEEV